MTAFRRLLCGLGLHARYVDTLLFSEVERCKYCSSVNDRQQAELFDLEYHIWQECRHLPVPEQIRTVAILLALEKDRFDGSPLAP